MARACEILIPRRKIENQRIVGLFAGDLEGVRTIHGPPCKNAHATGELIRQLVPDAKKSDGMFSAL